MLGIWSIDKKLYSQTERKWHVIVVQIFFMTVVATNPRKIKIVEKSAVAAANIVPVLQRLCPSSMTFGEHVCRRADKSAVSNANLWRLQGLIWP